MAGMAVQQGQHGRTRGRSQGPGQRGASTQADSPALQPGAKQQRIHSGKDMEDDLSIQELRDAAIAGEQARASRPACVTTPPCNTAASLVAPMFAGQVHGPGTGEKTDPLQKEDPWHAWHTAGALKQAPQRMPANSPDLAARNLLPKFEASSAAPASYACSKGAPAYSGATSSTDANGIPAELPQLEGNEYAKTSDVNALLATFNQRTQASIQRAQDKVQQDLQLEVTQLVGRVDASFQNQIEVQRQELAEVRTTGRELSRELADVLTRLTRAENALHLANAPRAEIRDAMEAEDFDKEPDLGVIQFNTKESVTAAAITAACKDWFAYAGMDSEQDMVVRGPSAAVGMYWKIAVHGADGVAARKAKKLLDILRTGGDDGKWMRIFVEAPTGRKVESFISPDKSRKREATERLTKKALSALEGKVPGKLKPLKADGIVLRDGKPMVRITPLPDGSFDVFWNPGLVPSGLDKSSIVAAMERQPSGAALAASVQWER